MSEETLSSSRTVSELFCRRVAQSPERTAYESKIGGGWQATTYGTYGKQVAEATLGLSALGVKRGTCVAIWGDTMAEWTILDLGAMAAGGHVAGIYQSTAEEQVVYILNDTQASILCVDTPERLSQALALSDQTPSVTHYVLWSGGVPSDERVTHLDTLYQTGAARATDDPGRYEALWQAVQPEDYAVLIYTSGTTGNPKGVVLSHGNCVANAVNVVDTQQESTEEDTMIAFLPMSHVAEHTCSFMGRIYSGMNAYFCPDMTQVGAVMKEKSPTVLVAVPRVYEKIYHRVQDAVSQAPAGKQRLFRWAMAVGGEMAQKQIQQQPVGPWLGIRHWLADRLVLSKIRAQLGGRLRAVTSGAAPIDDDIVEFFLALGILFCESYGLSEYGGCSHISARHALRIGTVGKAVNQCEVRIAEDGEVLMRSPSVFQGYLNNEKATREVLDDEGWLYTGDIGEIDEDGFLKITDRKKNLIITAGGKNVAPSNIEILIKRESLIGEVVIVGDRKPYLVALITLSPEMMEQNDYSDEEIERRVSEAIDHANLQLARYEQVKRFHILDGNFTVEGGEMTPTMKIKRNVVLANNEDVIAELYAKEQAS